MKTALILAVSADIVPYYKMIETSLNTWDSIEVEGCETVFYCGESTKPDNEKIIYLPVFESLHTMGQKMLLAFEWALKNRDFDYIARVNASCYVNKNELINHIQALPGEDYLAGIEVAESKECAKWLWGGGQYIISKDVIQKIVDNKRLWNHQLMEDMALSFLCSALGIPFAKGNACSIDRHNDRWLCLCYGTESFQFDTFEDINKSKGQYFFRVKQDYDRNKDKFVMEEIFKYLK